MQSILLEVSLMIKNLVNKRNLKFYESRGYERLEGIYFPKCLDNVHSIDVYHY